MGQVKMGELEHAAWPGVQVRIVRDRGIDPGEVRGLLAPRLGRLRREFAGALVTSVHEAWLQELKHAVTDAGIDAINAQWAPEVRRAKQAARQLDGEPTAEQVRARIAREWDAAFEAARYRLGQLLRRALEDGGA